MKPVRIFDIQFDKKARDEFYSYCEQIFSEGYLTNHTFVKKAEELYSSLFMQQNAIAVNNGTSALLAAFLAIDIAGYEVIMPTNTFIACWLAVVQAGGIPVLVDMDPKHLGLDLSQVRSLITKKTKAILTVHIGGIISPEIAELQELCKTNKLVLVEDCAHASGSTLNGLHAGKFGAIACFSFHLTKTITSGEGGLVTTDSTSLAKKVLSIRQFGKSEGNPHMFENFGGNFKLSELQAALMLTDLNRSKIRIAQRQKIAFKYIQSLDSNFWNFIKPTPGAESSFYKVMCRPNTSRSKLADFLKKFEIQLPNGVYYTPLHNQPIVKTYGLTSAPFLEADKFSEKHVCLPCYPELQEDQINYTIDCLKNFEKENS